LLILLPPSETKHSGGVGISIDKLAIIWAALDPTRDVLIAALERLCKKPEAAAKALKLGKKPEPEIAKNLAIMTSGTMPAVERYNGVLYDALDFASLSESAKRRATERLFIQSALFGLLPATEQIPDYRFSASSSLPGINLKQLWREAHQLVWPRMQGEILDLRSKSYVELNPIPNTHVSYFVDVVGQDGKALNHFNKRAKGLLVRSALERSLESVDQLPKIAKAAGLQVEIDGHRVVLVAPSGI
jgi:uncharacterized protein